MIRDRISRGLLFDEAAASQGEGIAYVKAERGVQVQVAVRPIACQTHDARLRRTDTPSRQRRLRLPVPVILKGGNMGREQLAELVSFTTLASQ
jgi:hypothetical protein